MKRNKKNVYQPPVILGVEVELEQGIAAGSATGTPSPSVNDWGNGSSDSQNGDF